MKTSEMIDEMSDYCTQVAIAQTHCDLYRVTIHFRDVGVAECVGPTLKNAVKQAYSACIDHYS